jgi:hypothetical protein
MTMSFPAAGAGLLRCARVLCLAGAAALTGCSTIYVDGSTREVNAASYKKPVEAKPVQLVFEFQSKGAPNGAATKLLKDQVVEQVKTSGLFSQVAETPVNGGALLSVTLNNVPLTDDAFSKGFMTGFTFGLVGSQVSDGYVCTAKYMVPNASQPITKSARHAIHTVLGTAAAPQNAQKADNVEAAVRTMTRQVVSAVLNDLSQDVSSK